MTLDLSFNEVQLLLNSLVTAKLTLEMQGDRWALEAKLTGSLREKISEQFDAQNAATSDRVGDDYEYGFYWAIEKEAEPQPLVLEKSEAGNWFACGVDCLFFGSKPSSSDEERL